MAEVDLEKVRTQTLRVLALPETEDFWEWLSTSTIDHPGAGRSAADLRDAFLYGMERADLRWVPKATAKLAESRASASPPPEIDPSDMPSPHGLLVFEEPLTALRFSYPDEEDIRIEMTGLLWTSVQSRQGARGVAAYALSGDVYMPSIVVVLPYGRRVKPIAERRAVFFNLLQEFWLLVR